MLFPLRPNNNISVVLGAKNPNITISQPFFIP